jgi:hypothetical protein
VGTSVLAILSRKPAGMFADLGGCFPGVGAGLVPLEIPFSLVTNPLSWANLDDRE